MRGRRLGGRRREEVTMGNGRRDAGARGDALRSGMVATCVAMAMAAVRTRLHRARARLRRMLREEER